VEAHIPGEHEQPELKRGLSSEPARRGRADTSSARSGAAPSTSATAPSAIPYRGRDDQLCGTNVSVEAAGPGRNDVIVPSAQASCPSP